MSRVDGRSGSSHRVRDTFRYVRETQRGGERRKRRGGDRDGWSLKARKKHREVKMGE